MSTTKEYLSTTLQENNDTIGEPVILPENGMDDGEDEHRHERPEPDDFSGASDNPER